VYVPAGGANTGAATLETGCVSVTVAVPVMPPLPVAVIVTVLDEGIVEGAVNVPPDVIDPADADHVTVCPPALNVFDAPSATVAFAGETVTGVANVTCKVFDASVPGFLTDTATWPAVPHHPAADNCVDETKLVGSAMPPNVTPAPETNPLPFTVTVKLPVGTGLGDTDVNVGPVGSIRT
jgi:hypothetical protein